MVGFVSVRGHPTQEYLCQPPLQLCGHGKKFQLWDVNGSDVFTFWVTTFKGRGVLPFLSAFLAGLSVDMTAATGAAVPDLEMEATC